MENKELAKKIIKELNGVKKQSTSPGAGSLLSLFKMALVEQGVDNSFLVPENKNIEKVSFKSFDDINLSGMVIKNNESKKWVIGMHGYSSTKEAMSQMVYFLTKFGYNLFLFDFRNHGESDDSLITFGVNEKKDLVSAINYISDNYVVDEIGLYGASMGAFTMNYFSLTEQEVIKNKKVKFGISDSTYISIYDLKLSILSRNWPIIGPMINGLTKEIQDIYQDEYGVNLRKADCNLLLDLAPSTFPVLYIHGENDKVTKAEWSKEFYEKRKNIDGSNDELKIFSDGPHVRSFIKNTDDYINTVKLFIEKVG